MIYVIGIILITVFLSFTVILAVLLSGIDSGNKQIIAEQRKRIKELEDELNDIIIENTTIHLEYEKK